MVFFYNISIGAYLLGIRIASLFNPKAKKWIKGRNNWRTQMQQAIDASKETIWFHCASLGEFEQGRPLIEAIRKQHPTKQIVLTFFSPSGYEVRKDYSHANHVWYLPIDTRSNAKFFIQTIQPTLAIFVKYEFWHHYLNTLHQQQIPTYVVSANFRKEQRFFKWYGGWFRKLLGNINHLFLQNEASAQLLNNIDLTNHSVSGDTRFDRVSTLNQHAHSIPIIEEFKNNKQLLIAGSTWQEDEKVLAPFINTTGNQMKYIIAPHEIHASHIDQVIQRLSLKTIRYSEATVEKIKEADVLIIDNIGMLSNLYQYGDVAYIGGAFGKGLHNILEAATYELPVIFGPHYSRFREAKELIDLGGAFSINNTNEFQQIVTTLLSNKAQYTTAAQASGQYIKSNKGATQKIMQHLEKHLKHGEKQ